MPAPDRGHVNDCAFDRLDTIILVENTAFSHAVVLIQGESVRVGAGLAMGSMFVNQVFGSAKPLLKHCLQWNGTGGEGLRPQCFPWGRPVQVSVSLLRGISIDFDHALSEIDDPNLGYLAACVERELGISIMVEAGIGHFDEQQDIGWARQFLFVIVVSRFEEHDIWYKLTPLR